MAHGTTRADLEAARRLFASACRFETGAATAVSFPKSLLPEVAFAGRSNAGKSRLLNTLTGRRALARVSRAPGRTRQINFFRLADRLMLADLPGYGFAHAAKREQARWSALVSEYLQSRRNLRRVLLLVDARRGLMPRDRDVMALLDAMAAPYQIVLTKCDAMPQSEIEALRQSIAGELKAHMAAHPEVAATSAETMFGIPELRLSLTHLVRP